MSEPGTDADVRVVLLGMMGSGKTTVGREIERRSGWGYVDNDDLLRELTGKGPDQLGDELGPDGLHDLEVDALALAVGKPGPLVAGAAGFVVEDARTPEILAGAFVVYLRARVETLAARVGRGEGRPWLRDDPAAALRRLLLPRAAAYEKFADLVVDVDGATPGRVAELIVAAVRDRLR